MSTWNACIWRPNPKAIALDATVHIGIPLLSGWLKITFLLLYQYTLNKAAINRKSFSTTLWFPVYANTRDTWQ